MENSMSTTYQPPMMTYDEWLKKAGIPSSPTVAEAYRRYVARFEADNPDR